MKQKVLTVVTLVVSLATFSFSTDLFKDDFASASYSNKNWVGSNGLTISTVNESYKLVNGSTTSSSILSHTFATKPSLFTFSAKISHTGGNELSGFYFCKGSYTEGNQVFTTGYLIAIDNSNSVQVFKQSQSGDTSVFTTTTGFLHAQGLNSIVVSKQNTLFNIFCNNRFIGSFNDAAFNSGDIGVYIGPGQTVTVDDILVTDQFTTGTLPTSFTDKFNDNEIFGWANYTYGASIIEKDTSLTISTRPTDSAYAFVYTDLKLTNFVSRVVVSHRDSSKNAYYGIVLLNNSIPNVPIRKVNFGINAERNYGIFDSIAFTPALSTSIGGAAFQGEYYYDTLEVIKRAGSNEYLFIVNSDTLTKYNDVNFPITGIGVFTGNNVKVQFNNFAAAEGTTLPSPVKNIGKPLRISQGNLIASRAYIVDPLGRIVTKSLTHSGLVAHNTGKQEILFKK